MLDVKRLNLPVNLCCHVTPLLLLRAPAHAQTHTRARARARRLGDGKARLFKPTGVAVDPRNGNIVVAAGSNEVGKFMVKIMVKIMI